MKKKLIFGSMLVLPLLLLMPTIPAIQQNLVKNKKIVESLETNLKFPILNGIIYFLLIWRFIRAFILHSISFNGTGDGRVPDFEILHPILFYRAVWLGISYDLLLVFFMIISCKFGLNWTLPNIFIG